MEQDNTQYKTITQTSPDTILCDGVVWMTREKYMEHAGLSQNSIASLYFHVKSGKAERIDFFNMTFFRSL